MKLAEVLKMVSGGGVYQMEEVTAEGLIIISATETGISICGGDMCGYYQNAQELMNSAAAMNKADTEFERYKTRAELKAEISAMTSEIRTLQAQLKNKTNEARHYCNALEKMTKTLKSFEVYYCNMLEKMAKILEEVEVSENVD